MIKASRGSSIKERDHLARLLTSVRPFLPEVAWVSERPQKCERFDLVITCIAWVFSAFCNVLNNNHDFLKITLFQVHGSAVYPNHLDTFGTTSFT